MRTLILILVSAMCLVGCAGTDAVPITRLPTLRLEVADYTTGESAICELHHVLMVRTVIPIAYGLIQPDTQAQARYVASTNSFPHAETFVLGGCVVNEDSPKSAIIYTCPECKQAAAQWDSVYGKH